MTGGSFGIDYTITIGNFLEVGSFISAGVLMVLTMRADIKVLKRDDHALGARMDGIQDELKKLNTIITDQAVMNQRVAAIEQDYRLLRRGKGFITDG